MTSDRHRTAAHEAGHAVSAWLLDRDVVLVSIEPAAGHYDGPCSMDKLPPEPLNGRRRPAAHWHQLADEAIVVLAGPLAELLADEYDDPPLPVPEGERVPPPPRLADKAVVQGRDKAQLEQLLTAMSTTEEEAAAFGKALTLRAEGFVRHGHFAALHEHLTAALMRDGKLDGDDVRVELQRAELRYTTQHLTEAM